MDTAFLRKSKLFRGMTEEEILSALACFHAQEKRYKKGQTLLHAGKSIDCLFRSVVCLRFLFRSRLAYGFLLAFALQRIVFRHFFAQILVQSLSIAVDIVCTVERTERHDSCNVTSSCIRR